jgi:hypothetical protein
MGTNDNLNNFVSIENKNIFWDDSNNLIWTDDNVIDFINWYITLHELDDRYCLENQEIINSFKRGDSTELWKDSIYENIIDIENEEIKEIENETDELLNSQTIKFLDK